MKTRDTSLLKKIALKLIAWRSEKNLTQEEVYLETGINIGRLERAQLDVSITTLKRLCRYYRKTLIALFENIE